MYRAELTVPLGFPCVSFPLLLHGADPGTREPVGTMSWGTGWSWFSFLGKADSGRSGRDWGWRELSAIPGSLAGLPQLLSLSRRLVGMAAQLRKELAVISKGPEGWRLSGAFPLGTS